MFLVLCLITSCAPLLAATLPPWGNDIKAPEKASQNPFQEAVEAFTVSYNDIPGPLPPRPMRMGILLVCLLSTAWLISGALPKPGRRGHRLPQAALAALANSRMR